MQCDLLRTHQNEHLHRIWGLSYMELQWLHTKEVMLPVTTQVSLLLAVAGEGAEAEAEAEAEGLAAEPELHAWPVLA